MAAHLPEAPDILGLTFRAFQGACDYPPIVAVSLRCWAADQIDRVITVEDVARRFAHLDNCDPYRDMLFAEVDGQVIGFVRVSWEQETEGARIHLHRGDLLPAWRGKGIGGAMLAHAERRLRAIASEHPKDGPRFFQAGAADTQTGKRALLEQRGYQPVRHFFEMVRRPLEDLPQAPMPAGLEVRPASREHYRIIWEAMDEAFRDHWAHSPATENDFQEWLKSPMFQPELWKVAWDGDQVAGMVLNFIDHQENQTYGRKRGYTEDISVRRPWRRRGLARALLLRSLHELRSRGMTEAALGVDTDNPTGALRLYQGLGYRSVKRYTTYRKPLNGSI
jgi:mycothiol synthase